MLHCLSTQAPHRHRHRHRWSLPHARESTHGTWNFLFRSSHDMLEPWESASLSGLIDVVGYHLHHRPAIVSLHQRNREQVRDCSYRVAAPSQERTVLARRVCLDHHVINCTRKVSEERCNRLQGSSVPLQILLLVPSLQVPARLTARLLDHPIQNHMAWILLQIQMGTTCLTLVNLTLFELDYILYSTSYLVPRS